MRITFRIHAIQRMFERSVTVEDVHNVIESCETIEFYAEDTPYPSRLVLGWRGTRPLHVVLADNAANDEVIVVTVYEPELAQWEAGYRRRKR